MVTAINSGQSDDYPSITTTSLSRFIMALIEYDEWFPF